jgi:hypothetical protein
MKTKHYLLLLLMAAAGFSCSGSTEEPFLETDIPVSLAVGQLAGGDVTTRAAIEAWSNTPVSLAYRTASTYNDYHVNVVVPANSSPQTIDTGLAYATDDTPLYIRGYHPVANMSGGLVNFDLSKGDVDLMYSNEVSGKQSAPITAPLLFKHRLTRLAFVLQCDVNKSYPKVVVGIRISDANTLKPILSKATLDLNSGTYTFSIPNAVIGFSATNPDGFGVPPNGSPEYIDMMIVPNAPFVVSVIMSDNTEVIVPLDSSLDDVTGGAEGKVYTVNLLFGGNTILAGKIDIADDWVLDTSLPGKTGTNSGAWW